MPNEQWADNDAGLSRNELHELCHDVLNPIGAAYGYVQLLERTLRAKHRLDNVERRLLVAIRQNLGYVARLLQALESQQLLTIQAVVELAAAQLPPHRQHDLSTHFEPEEAAAAECNGRTMLRVLGNLLSNAAKYSQPRTPIAVVVEVASGWVEVAVSDRGIGIAQNALEGIFQGVRTPDAMAAAPGSGLGLRLCQRLIRTDGGELWAESSPGQGSTFHVRAPLLD